MGTSQTSPGKPNSSGLDLEETSPLRSRQNFFLDIPFDRTHCLLGHLKPPWCLKTRGTGCEENHCGIWNCWDRMDDPIASYRLFQTRLAYRLSGHIRHEMHSIQRHCTVFSIRLGFKCLARFHQCS